MGKVIDIEKARELTNENYIKKVMNDIYMQVDKAARAGDFHKIIKLPIMIDNDFQLDISIETIVTQLVNDGFQALVIDYTGAKRWYHKTDIFIVSKLMISCEKDIEKMGLIDIGWDDHPVEGTKAHEFYKIANVSGNAKVDKFLNTVNEAIEAAAINGMASCRVPIDDLSQFQIQAVLDQIAKAGYKYKSQKLRNPYGGRSFDIVINW